MNRPTSRDHYDPRARVTDALGVYYARNGFAADGGSSEGWVRFAVGPLQVVFPNTAGRKRAIRHHDLHHTATGYQTTVVGEAEIGAWEVASGCGHVPIAWFLNSVALAGGLFVRPGRVLRAYARGLRSRNTYSRVPGELEVLTLAELQKDLGLDAPDPAPSLSDTIRFVGVAARSVIFCGSPALIVFLGPALATTA